MQGAIRLLSHCIVLTQNVSGEATRWLFSAPSALFTPLRQLGPVNGRGLLPSAGRDASGTEQLAVQVFGAGRHQRFERQNELVGDLLQKLGMSFRVLARSRAQDNHYAQALPPQHQRYSAV